MPLIIPPLSYSRTTIAFKAVSSYSLSDKTQIGQLNEHLKKSIKARDWPTVVSMLATLGDVDAANSRFLHGCGRWTLLHEAAHSGNAELLRALIDRRYDADLLQRVHIGYLCSINNVPRGAFTALELAVVKGRRGTITCLKSNYWLDSE